MRTTLILLCLLVLPVGAKASQPAGPAPAALPAVLVTGASTGIGRKTTELLASRGHFVFAGARREQDLKALNAIPNVAAVRLDVTSPGDVAAAVETVRASGRPLAAIVNNAGVAMAGPLMSTKDEDFDFLMQVNVFGVLRVTKAFAPLVIASKGRIVNISSLSGTISRPELGAYSMSKHAIEAFTDSLAGELAPQGVAVVAIEPGNYNTEIARSGQPRSQSERFTPDRSQYKDPDEVAETVLQAISEPSPRRRYLVTPNQAEAEFIIRTATQELVQLNEGQRYTFDREALLRFLDEYLAKARPRTAE